MIGDRGAGDRRAGPPGMPMEMTHAVLGLATRYREAGLVHPVAAATAVAARGVIGTDRAAFAEQHGLDEELVEDCEAGRVPFAALPDAVGALVEGSGYVCLLQLADLDREVRRQDRRVEAFRQAAFSWALDQPADGAGATGLRAVPDDRVVGMRSRRRPGAAASSGSGAPWRSDGAAQRMIHELLYSRPVELG